MATSQNGWPAGQDRRQLGVDQKFSAGGVLIAGGVLAGDVATVLGYVAEQFHRRVERLVSGWCWGHAYRPIRGQTTGLSNHASATAMDLNAPNHPQGRRGTFTAAEAREIRTILAEVDGVVRWGGDYTGTPDEMHFEINAPRARVAAVAARLRGQTEEDDVSKADVIDALEEFFDRRRIETLAGRASGSGWRGTRTELLNGTNLHGFAANRALAALAVKVDALTGELSDTEADILAALRAREGLTPEQQAEVIRGQLDGSVLRALRTLLTQTEGQGT